MTQLGTIRLGKRTDNRVPQIKDFVPLATLDELEFGAWDLFADNAYESAATAKVLRPQHLESVRPELEALKPMTAAFYPEYVRRLHGTHCKTTATKADMVEALRDDIRRFKADKKVDRVVAVWCGSTETYVEPAPVHEGIEAFEKGLAANDPAITSSMLYAWACLKEGIPFANGAPQP